MKIMRQFTLRTLMKNKMRTFVTIIGIVLATSLFTAVLEGWYSVQNYMMDYETAKNGSWTNRFENVLEDDVDKVTSIAHVNDYTKIQTLGYSKISDMESIDSPYLCGRQLSIDSPYLCVRQLQKNYEQFMPKLEIIEGRMAENDGELVVTNFSVGSEMENIKIGDTVTLKIGERVGKDGNKKYGAREYNIIKNKDEVKFELTEHLENLHTKTYTVVGISSELGVGEYTNDYLLGEAFVGYTVGEEKGIITDIYAHADQLSHAKQISKDIMKIYNANPEYMNIVCDYRESDTLHDNLLEFSGVGQSTSFMTMIYSVCAILIGIVMVASIALIYNAFAISVSERTKLYGLLRSIGATKKQIRASVLFEAGVLCLIGVPLGILVGLTGIGITLYAVDGWFHLLIGTEINVHLSLAVSPVFLTVVTALSIVTVLISAFYPARRAVAITIIDTLRQNRDIKILKRVFRKGKLSYKLFGFSGMLAKKNGMRNPRKQRTIVASLSISILLFMTVSSFVAYLEASTSGIESKASYDVFYSNSNDVMFKEDYIDRVKKVLEKVKEVDQLSYSFNAYGFLVSKEADLNTNKLVETVSDKAIVQMKVFFVEDENYKEFLKREGLSLDKYMSTDQLCPVYDDSYNFYDENLKKRISGHYLKEQGLENANCYCIKYKDSEECKNLDFYGAHLNENGEPYVEVNEIKTEDGTDDKDEERTAKEMSQTLDLAAGHRIDGLYPLGVSDDKRDDEINVFLPFSAWKTNFQKIPLKYNLFFGMKAKQHKQLVDKLSGNEIFDEDFSFTDDDSYYSRCYGDQIDSMRSQVAMIGLIKVFSYGFLIIVCLIIVANIFNTISTNIMLRRQEFAMLQSVGMSRKSLKQMLRYESMIYGVKALIFGLPISFFASYGIYKALGNEFSFDFFIPIGNLCEVVGGIFAIVFASMVYSREKIKNDNPIETLRNDMI
ncbi:MAG: FtsX-like permease family protein [Lachnospiraceae bacterium]|nr:FtsX-like permease family protein [Lachnospiraceae bacterium]